MARKARPVPVVTEEDDVSFDDPLGLSGGNLEFEDPEGLADPDLDDLTPEDPDIDLPDNVLEFPTGPSLPESPLEYKVSLGGREFVIDEPAIETVRRFL